MQRYVIVLVLMAIVPLLLTGLSSTQNLNIYAASDKETQDSKKNQAQIIITKTILSGSVHDNGDFNAEVIGKKASPSSVNVGTDPEDRTVTIKPGDYTVHEIGESGGQLALGEFVYDVSYSEECSGVIKAGEVKECNITNDPTYDYP